MQSICKQKTEQNKAGGVYGDVTSAQPELALVETLAALDEYCSHGMWLLAEVITTTPHKCTICLALA